MQLQYVPKLQTVIDGGNIVSPNTETFTISASGAKGYIQYCNISRVTIRIDKKTPLHVFKHCTFFHCIIIADAEIENVEEAFQDCSFVGETTATAFTIRKT